MYMDLMGRPKEPNLGRRDSKVIYQRSSSVDQQIASWGMNLVPIQKLLAQEQSTSWEWFHTCYFVLLFIVQKSQTTTWDV